MEKNELKMDVKISKENQELFSDVEEFENSEDFEESEEFEESEILGNKKIEEKKQTFVFETLSQNESKKVILEEDDKTKIFVIKKAEILKPYTINSDGEIIEPKPFSKDNPEKKGYKSKLRIEYENCDYISLLPNIHWYISKINGQTILKPWFNIKVTEDDLSDIFTSEICKLYFKFCKKYNYEVGKLTQYNFINELVGKKVKLKQYVVKNKHTNNELRYRIDILEFV